MKKDNERNEVNNKKYEAKETTYHLLKDPRFYLMIFLWLFAFCSASYAVLIGAIVPY